MASSRKETDSSDQSWKTAIQRSKLSSPATWLRERDLIVGRVLDFGSGRGGDALRLGAEQFDPYFSPEQPSGKFDTVICIYVLNVIEDERERLAVEDILYSWLAPGGIAYIAVRNDSGALKGRTSTGTWQGKVAPSSFWKLIEKNKNFRLYARRKLWKHT